MSVHTKYKNLCQSPRAVVNHLNYDILVENQNISVCQVMAIFLKPKCVKSPNHCISAWRNGEVAMAYYNSCGSPWASYQIRKIAGCACAGNAGNVPPRRQFQRKPLVSDPAMHHGTCVTHVPWCMSGSLTYNDGENVPSIPGACALAILRIWQEAHGTFSISQGYNHQNTMRFPQRFLDIVTRV